MNVVIHADSGPATGLGHVQRCLALAAALAELGAECSFVVPDVPAVRERIEHAGFPVSELPAGLLPLAMFGHVLGHHDIARFVVQIDQLSGEA